MTLPAKLLLPCLGVLALLSLPVHAQDAISGVDVVSLRDSGRAIGGDASISTEWKGRHWVFANEANRAAFESDPRAYVPAFNGNCPVALSEGQRTPGSPRFPVVVDGTLYLTGGASAQGLLRSDPQAILNRAASVWGSRKR